MAQRLPWPATNLLGSLYLITLALASTRARLAPELLAEGLAPGRRRRRRRRRHRGAESRASQPLQPSGGAASSPSSAPWLAAAPRPTRERPAPKARPRRPPRGPSGLSRAGGGGPQGGKTAPGAGLEPTRSQRAASPPRPPLAGRSEPVRAFACRGTEVELHLLRGLMAPSHSAALRRRRLVSRVGSGDRPRSSRGSTKRAGSIPPVATLDQSSC
eukprot:scaffold569_cov408-Prasinococcus_capsulatus_cf.AAC.19